MPFSKSFGGGTPLSKSAEPLIVKRNDVIFKQYPSVEYLECLLDNTLSGEDMAVKVLTKVNGRLRFYTGRANT